MEPLWYVAQWTNNNSAWRCFQLMLLMWHQLLTLSAFQVDRIHRSPSQSRDSKRNGRQCRLHCYYTLSPFQDMLHVLTKQLITI